MKKPLDIPAGGREGFPPAETPVNASPRRARAVGLVSGGLDSTLALAVLKAQGVEVKALNFYTGFCTAEVNRRVGGKHAEKPVAANAALAAASQTESDVEMIDISREYIRMVLRPKHGYGKNLNPCIDCRIMMLSKARQIMEAEGADFVFTGEVLGQRPMSQHLRSLRVIEREAGLQGRLLRPLSAPLLPETHVEQEGRVDRSRLPTIQGRSRRAQLDLADRLGIRDYPTPSGGCCQLTDPNFARKFRDLAQQRLDEADGDIDRVRIDTDDTVLLGVGRHFRLGPRTRLIVGRDADENRLLEIYRDRCADRFATLQVRDFKGPLALLDGLCDGTILQTAAAVTARYSDGKDRPTVTVDFQPRGSVPLQCIEVGPLADEAVRPLRI